MAGEEGGQGSGGSPGTTAPGAPPTGGAAPLTGAKPPEVVAGIKMDMLPKELRELVEGRSEAEQKVILNNLVGTVRRQQDTIRKLEAKPATPTAAPDEKPKPKKPPEEAILEDAEGVVLDVISRHFGDRFTKVEKAVGDSALGSIRSEDPEFSEYEDEVKNILNESKAEYTRENILGAYTMAIGSKQLAERRRLTASNHNPETPKTPADGPEPKTREYTQLEKDIAAAHRKTPEEYFAHVDFATELKVPTNPPKKKVEAANG